MDKEKEKRAIKTEATSFPAPISDRYVYVQQDDTFTLSDEEFELVKKILSFMRGRKRGSIMIKIITQQKTRYALTDYVDTERSNLDFIE